MFREGTNFKGLLFFIIIILAIFVYLSWQSGGVVTEDEGLSINPVKNYHVSLTYDNATYELWRYDHLLKFQQDEQLQFYYDSLEDSLRVYNQDRLIAPTSNFSDFITKYDPYQVINEMKASLSYDNKDADRQFSTELYGDKAKLYLNDNDLPDTILFDNSGSKIQYMYLSVNDISIIDALPQIAENED